MHSSCKKKTKDYEAEGTTSTEVTEVSVRCFGLVDDMQPSSERMEGDSLSAAPPLLLRGQRSVGGYRLQYLLVMLVTVFLTEPPVRLVAAKQLENLDAEITKGTRNDTSLKKIGNISNSTFDLRSISGRDRPLTSDEEREEALFMEWIRSMQEDGDDEVEGILNGTSVPTLILNETEVDLVDSEMPSPFPTQIPTQTAAPTPLASEFPTNIASASPTLAPTRTFQPSISPTRTFAPSEVPSLSQQPTRSPQPTSSPSGIPTIMPSSLPSSLPTGAPTVSSQPSTSHQPTRTFAPTLSFAPTMRPTSQFPSQAPSLSVQPSGLPSVEPSPAPTISVQPSNSPTVSNAPTLSNNPTQVPSEIPTDFPSATPTEPSEFPSLFPTIQLEEPPYFNDKVYMILDGLPGKLTPTQIEIWQNVTSQHIINYWSTLYKDHPEDTPLFVASVNTTLFEQEVLAEQQSVLSDANNNENGGGQNNNEEEGETAVGRNEDGQQNQGEQNTNQAATVVQIYYTQLFDFGVYGDSKRPDDETLQTLLVLLPFQSDSYDYSNALVQALNISNFVFLIEIEAGDPAAPPTQAPSSQGISTTAVRAISASIVVGACLIVAFLLWDRKRKDHGRFPGDSESEFDDSRHMRRRGMDTMEFDNAGQPVDWTNPYAVTALVRDTVGGGGGDTGATVASGGGSAGGNRSGATSASSRSGEQYPEIPAGPLSRAISIRSMPGNLGSGSSGGDNRGTTGTLSTAASSTANPPPPTPFGVPRPTPSRRSDPYPQSQRSTSTGNLPPLAPSGTSGFPNGGNGRYSSGSAGRSQFGSSPFTPQPFSNFRHTSITDTEITDLTYSDLQSEGRGSDVGNLAQLPPISDAP